jgi:hypothetical protein
MRRCRNMGLSWPLGADNLTIVSVGTGYSRPGLVPGSVNWMKPIGMALAALQAQIGEAQQLVMTLMSWLGESPTPWSINSELGDISKTSPPFNRPLFRFLRYDIRFDQAWLAANGRDRGEIAHCELRADGCPGKHPGDL